MAQYLYVTCGRGNTNNIFSTTAPGGPMTLASCQAVAAMNNSNYLGFQRPQGDTGTLEMALCNYTKDSTTLDNFGIASISCNASGPMGTGPIIGDPGNDAIYQRVINDVSMFQNLDPVAIGQAPLKISVKSMFQFNLILVAVGGNVYFDTKGDIEKWKFVNPQMIGGVNGFQISDGGNNYIGTTGEFPSTLKYVIKEGSNNGDIFNFVNSTGQIRNIAFGQGNPIFINLGGDISTLEFMSSSNFTSRLPPRALSTFLEGSSISINNITWIAADSTSGGGNIIPPSNPPSDTGLSTGEIIGIVIGIIVLLIIIGVIIYFATRK